MLRYLHRIEFDNLKPKNRTERSAYEKAEHH